MALGSIDLVNLLIKTFLNTGLPVGLDVWRTISMCTLLYHSVARFSCIKELLISNLVFNNDLSYVTVNFPSSKTDQRKKGKSSIINACGGPFCPVLLLKTYCEELLAFEGTPNFSYFLFPKLIITPHCISFATSSVTYSVALSQFRLLLPTLGLDPKLYGLHSFRRGAATKLANLGVPNEVINIAGRWSSHSAVNAYIEYDVDFRRNLSSKLS